MIYPAAKLYKSVFENIFKISLTGYISAPIIKENPCSKEEFYVCESRLYR